MTLHSPCAFSQIAPRSCAALPPPTGEESFSNISQDASVRAGLADILGSSRLPSASGLGTGRKDRLGRSLPGQKASGANVFCKSTLWNLAADAGPYRLLPLTCIESPASVMAATGTLQG